MQLHTKLLIAPCAVLALLNPPWAKTPGSIRNPRLSIESSTTFGAQAPYIYDPDPNHLWNRMHRQFFVRKHGEGHEHGADELDPLLWSRTKYLLEGQSHLQAVQILDEFLSTNGERLITDPLKRAIMQRDMGAVFDWLALPSLTEYQQARIELRSKVAAIIQRLALTSDQIHALPDTYAAALASGVFPHEYNPAASQSPFLPGDLFDAKGPWVCLRGKLDPSAAIAHRNAFHGRSVFLVFIRLPGGRESTLAYLQRLNAFPKFFIPQPTGYHPLLLQPDGIGVNAPPGAHVANPRLPQFPPKTEVALVRQMVLIDNNGEMMSTRLTESLQIRVFPAIPSWTEWRSDPRAALQDVFEFKLSRSKLFAGESGGLREVTQDEPELNPFISSGIDEFDEPETFQSSPRRYISSLKSCAQCHGAPGVHSMIATRVIFNSKPTPGFLPSSPLEQAEADFNWRRQQEDWHLLQSFWMLDR